MSYQVEGYWQESVIEEFDTLEEALAAGRRYADAHPDTVIAVRGPGISADLFEITAEVVV